MAPELLVVAGVDDPVLGVDEVEGAGHPLVGHRLQNHARDRVYQVQRQRV